MRTNHWNGEILSAMQHIESIRPSGSQKGTVVKLSQAESYQSQSPYLQGNPFVMPPSTICIADFTSLGPALSAPCRGSFAGIVQQ
eukprot:643328-Karenia_brevis.AAC.1